MAESGSRALAILFLVTFIDMIGFGIVIPFLTYLVEDLAQAKGISAVGLWVGIIMTAYPFAQFIAAPIWGGLSDRIGRRPILLIGLITVSSYEDTMHELNIIMPVKGSASPSKCLQFDFPIHAGINTFSSAVNSESK